MDNIQPPKTIEEVGIHLIYMTRSMEDLSKKFDMFASNYVPISAFLNYKEEMEKELRELKEEAKNGVSFRERWTGRVWGINMTIGAIYGLAALLISHYWR
jgi:hypothetical protein